MDKTEITEIIKRLRSNFVAFLLVKICFLFILSFFLSITLGNKLKFDEQSVLWTFSIITVSSVTLFSILASLTIFRLQSDYREIGLRQYQLEAFVEGTEQNKSFEGINKKNFLDIPLFKTLNNEPKIKKAIFFYASTGKLNLAYECLFHFIKIQKLKSSVKNIRQNFFPLVIQIIVLIFISVVLTPLVGIDLNGISTEFFENANFRGITTSFCVFFIISFAFLILLDITKTLINSATLYEKETLDILGGIEDKDQ